MINTEDAIIQSLLTNKEFFTRTFSHLEKKHFEKVENGEIFKLIAEYYKDFQDSPKPKEIGLKIKDIKAEALRTATAEHFKEVVTDIKVQNIDFMVEETQKHVQFQEFKQALIHGADTLQKNGDLSPVYKMMGDALSVNFETDYGLEYTELDRRLEYYKMKNFCISTGTQTIDDYLVGWKPKTLNLVGAPPHTGKSVALTNFAASNTLRGEDGLYYTLEMSDFETAKRIDANILDIDINAFAETDDSVFRQKYNSISSGLGKIIIKEYPPSHLTALMIESHLQELKAEQGFVPKFIYIDYIGLMASSRASNITQAGGSFTYYKLVAEEVRSIAVKYGVIIISAVQQNRGAVGNQDSGMESLAESFAYGMVADNLFFLYKNAELDASGHLMLNFVKNRNTGKLGTVLIGVDYSRMRYYDVNVDSFTVNNIPKMGGDVSFGDFGAEADIFKTF